jgi:hypothetical protein
MVVETDDFLIRQNSPLKSRAEISDGLGADFDRLRKEISVDKSGRYASPR